MRPFVAAVIVLSVLLGEVSVLSAQTVPAAPEPPLIGGVFGGRRPPDRNNPDRSAHRVSLDLDVAGGYDKNKGIDETTFIGSDVQQGGSIGAGSMTFRHWWGTSRNFLQTTAHGNARMASAGVEQQVSARSQIRGVASLGRRAGLAMAVGSAYEPAYLFNAFGPLDASLVDGVPGAELSEGFTEQRWLLKSASGGLHRNWTTRQRTDVDYHASEREPLTGTGLISQLQSAELRHDWAYRERAALALRYRFDENRQTGGLEPLLPLQLHHAAVGGRFQRRFERDRAFGFLFNAGATYTRPRGGLPGSTETFIVPAASTGVQLRMSQSWLLSLDSSRNVTVLEGLVPHPFTTDAVSFTTNGKFGRRTDLVVNAAYSHGRATMNDRGAYETAISTVNLRHAIAVCCALTTTYMYYRHQLFDMTTVLAGFPSRYQRHSVRVGLSFWVPLFGSFPAN